MSNNEYEQQQFWKDEDPWKEFGKALSNYMKIRYDPKYFKSALSMLTENHKNDNNVEYKWDIDKNYIKKDATN
jgi:hypothetical protein